MSLGNIKIIWILSPFFYFFRISRKVNNSCRDIPHPSFVEKGKLNKLKLKLYCLHKFCHLKMHHRENMTGHLRTFVEKDFWINFSFKNSHIPKPYVWIILLFCTSKNIFFITLRNYFCPCDLIFIRIKNLYYLLFSLTLERFFHFFIFR